MHTSSSVVSRVLIALSVAGTGSASAQTQSHVYVRNETQHAIRVQDVELSGAAVSARPWTQGKPSVSPGERAIVLTLNRKGKVNWMDPTPRFIEPGKEVVFSSVIRRDDAPEATLVLLQKLFGTGESTKLWYSAEASGQERQWHIDESVHQLTWTAPPSRRWAVDLRSFQEDGETHVEYTFRPAP